MANAILNFHFDYLNPSLRSAPDIDGFGITTCFSAIMAHQILTLLLLSVVLTTAKSSDKEDLGKNLLESDRSQQMNNSSLLKVKSRGPRADNGCWQIKYHYRLQMVSK